MARPALVIRTTREDDWREVRDLRLEMLRDTPIAFGDRFERAVEFDEAEWRTRAKRGESATQTVIVAIEGDRWVGTMGCYVPDAATGPLLVGVYVTPDRRGGASGVADALLDEIERWAAGRADTLRLEVHEDNPRARRYYERRGFAYTGHRREYELEPGGLELEMVKRLR